MLISLRRDSEDLYLPFITDDDDEDDNDANNDNGVEMDRGEERKWKEGHGGGRGKTNIYQLLSACCLEFYFSGDGSRVISSFSFLWSSIYFHLICASWQNVPAI